MNYLCNPEDDDEFDAPQLFNYRTGQHVREATPLEIIRAQYVEDSGNTPIIYGYSGIEYIVL